MTETEPAPIVHNIPVDAGAHLTRDLRTIYERIADASVDIASEVFSKSEKVRGGYDYIPISQILEIIRRAHAKHGIFTIFGKPEYDPAQGEKRYAEIRRSKSDGRETRWQIANGHVKVKIYGRLGDCIKTVVACEAQDNSDKLTNLLMTNAQRTLYRTLYAIDEGGNDPEEFNIEATEEKHQLTEENMKNRRARPAENDPFFNGKPEPDPKPAPKDTTSDRPLETVQKCVRDWKDDLQTADIIKAAYEVHGTFEKWDERTWRQVYNACVTVFRKNGGRI